jgi:hypothetical protein
MTLTPAVVEGELRCAYEGRVERVLRRLSAG